MIRPPQSSTFSTASSADDGDPEQFEEALHSYRRALELDPYMVPALINLANIHYSRDETVEAQALYERAIALDADVFEAHFNLGNILHDLGRYPEALVCYREALGVNPRSRRAFLHGGHAGEDGSIAGGASALACVSASRP